MSPRDEVAWPRVHIPAVWPGSSHEVVQLVRTCGCKPAHFTVFPVLVSKYFVDVVGGADILAADSPWPSVCGCRAKKWNLLKPNAFALFVRLEPSTCDLERERRWQSFHFSEQYQSQARLDHPWPVLASSAASTEF